MRELRNTIASKITFGAMVVKFILRMLLGIHQYFDLLRVQVTQQKLYQMTFLALIQML